MISIPMTISMYLFITIPLLPPIPVYLKPKKK